MSQKIAVISFDHWNYDAHIVSALQEKGHSSFHIKIGNFKYKNKWERVKNSLTKLFLNKNPKLKKRQDYILEMLEKNGFQDQILVINPELIELDYHLKIKSKTKKYIAYLYDSVSRCPVEHLLDGVFDEVYSFDKDDVTKYGFIETTNYIYFDNFPPTDTIKQDFIYIGSIDNRIEYLQQIAEELKKNNKTFSFYAIGKKAFVLKLKQFLLGKNKSIIFNKNRFNQNETLQLYNESNVILDLVRDNQSGLSFRIFEAIGLQKNIVTNNKAVITYDLFQSNKIKTIDSIFDFQYSEKKYDNNLIEKYSIRNWTKTVFKL